MHRIIIISSILLLLNSCEQLVNIGGLSSSNKYPTNLGHEWEYSTAWKLEFYDTTGHIDSTFIDYFQNTIVKIIKDIDTIAPYTNLALFESYDLSSPQNINKTWYMNVDSGLFAIAYANAGASQFVWPKQINSTLEQLKKFMKMIGVFPGTFGAYNKSTVLSDSIQFYSPPRKVLNYPLAIGSRWIELTVPFFRERFINKQQIININGINYYCYKIESNWTWVPNLEFTDYVDLNSGLVMREIIADSVAQVSPDSPDIAGYFKSTTISKLVREKNW